MTDGESEGGTSGSLYFSFMAVIIVCGSAFLVSITGHVFRIL